MSSPIANMHGSRNKGVKKRIVKIIITPNDPLENTLVPVSMTLNFL